MDHLDTEIGRLKAVPLSQVKQQAMNLWVASFAEDTLAFAKAYFENYIRFVSSYFFINHAGELVLMAFNTNEGYANKKATLIEGVAVDKRFQGKGIMTVFMDQWIKELDEDYEYVFIQAYNWNIYKRYDFRPFNRNNLWEYTPDANEQAAKGELTSGYANKPFTDMQRSPLHFTSYFDCMVQGGASLHTCRTASLVLSGNYAVNVTYADQSDLFALLQAIGKQVTFLLPNDTELSVPGLKKLESNRLETKLYKRDLTGLFNYIF